jgi:hypothetical protein
VLQSEAIQSLPSIPQKKLQRNLEIKQSASQERRLSCGILDVVRARCLAAILFSVRRGDFM